MHTLLLKRSFHTVSPAVSQVRANGLTTVPSAKGVTVFGGGTSVAGGITVSPNGATVTGNVLGTGSLSVTSSLATIAADVYTTLATYNGNLITGRVPAGSFAGNLLYVTDGISSLLNVRFVQPFPVSLLLLLDSPLSSFPVFCHNFAHPFLFSHHSAVPARPPRSATHPISARTHALSSLSSPHRCKRMAGCPPPQAQDGR